MTTLTPKNKMAALLCGIAFLNLSLFALGGEMKNTDSTGKQNRIEIKDFAFNPQTLTVKSGEKITWINRDEEPHTIVSVEKQFKKSTRSEEHTSELQSQSNLVCRLLLENKKRRQHRD